MSSTVWTAGDRIDADDLNDMVGAKRLTAGETINGATLPVAVFLDDADNEWYACDGNDQARLDFQGFAISNGTNGNEIKIQAEGIVTGFSGLTVGERYYVQDDRTIGTSIGTYEVYVGIAIRSDAILIDKGTRSGFQYMGSVSGVGNLTVPEDARFVVIHIEWASGDDEIEAEIFLSKHGKTTGSLEFDNTNTGGGGSTDFRVAYSWSGTTITQSGDAPTAATAYIYR